MLIKDLMTRSPVCCKPSDTLDTVAKLMLENDCGEIPVCDGANLVGVITDRDITCRAVATGRTPMDVAVAEVMTHNPYIVHQDQKLDAALEVMEERRVRRLPVVDDQHRIVGIVSQADLVARAPILKVARLVKSVSKQTRGFAAEAR